MDDFDPVPRLNPITRGLLIALLVVGIGLALAGILLIGIHILVWGWQ